ncbi:MAG: hypothetical protein OEW97_02355 [Gammaproteobacteria bacterium]|nr:hypothetical protein [Gammaproteobacteria bacterium]
MSFLSETFQVPLWLLIFVSACAAPLWVKWYKMFYNKFIKTGLLKKNLQDAKTVAEEKMEILKKATHYRDAAVTEKKKQEGFQPSQTGQLNGVETNQPYVKIVLKTLALKGDAGMLIQSIADNLKIKSNEIKSSLTYLEKNGFVEGVATGTGQKYYLAKRGKDYCIKKGYISG